MDMGSLLAQWREASGVSGDNRDRTAPFCARVSHTLLLAEQDRAGRGNESCHERSHHSGCQLVSHAERRQSSLLSPDGMIWPISIPVSDLSTSTQALEASLSRPVVSSKV